ncbi:Hsp20/alpha crystallin family protein [Xylophilus sp.]|uniref:Hsp20/alpha crystallin family protein n=1 Tax=Xylophilus sp. TaxID=2653893 RepID=UPI0013BD89A8|nr:Hsp20/alpha crystallin family protein [Xylophilus sp.]KAF1045535.1 MAG: hypothetical protein GAK38_02984 [Xylophilus sp.]
MFFAPVLRRAAYATAPRSFDRALERLLHDALAGAPTTVSPRGRGYAITQDDKAYTAQIDVPGLSREQLTVGIEGSVVRVESVKDAPRQYRAAYELPQEIDVAASSARLDKGVLTLTLAKKAPVSNAATLAID